MSFLLELTKDLKKYRQDRFLLAVSGGLDSVALFHIFLHFQKNFQFEFAVAHFHHGVVDDSTQLQFRDQAVEFVRQLCEQHNILFFTNNGENSGSEGGTSEAELREARYGFLTEVKRQHSFQWIVTAHHLDDLLETRMMRLIRGTGVDGLQALKLEHEGRLRPLLKLGRHELQDWLTERQESWLEDPSNQNLGPLRNWMRHSWLKELDKKVPGGSLSLHRSLENLVSSLDQESFAEGLFPGDALDLAEFWLLGEHDQKRALATYMRGQGLKNYGLSHIKEVLKRLDTTQKSHTFQLLGCRWKVDAGRMRVEKAQAN